MNNLKHTVEKLISSLVEFNEGIDDKCETKEILKEAQKLAQVISEIPYGWEMLETGQKVKQGYKFIKLGNASPNGWETVFENENNPEWPYTFELAEHFKYIKPIEIPEGYILQPQGTKAQQHDRVKNIATPHEPWYQVFNVYRLTDCKDWYVASPMKKEFNKDWWNTGPWTLSGNGFVSRAMNKHNENGRGFETEAQAKEYAKWERDNAGRLRATQLVEAEIAIRNEGWKPDFSMTSNQRKWRFEYNAGMQRILSSNTIGIQTVPISQYFGDEKTGEQILAMPNYETYIRQMLGII